MCSLPWRLDLMKPTARRREKFNTVWSPVYLCSMLDRNILYQLYGLALSGIGGKVLPPDVDLWLTENDVPHSQNDPDETRLWKALLTAVQIQRSAAEIKIDQTTEFTPADPDEIPYCSFEAGQSLLKLIESKDWKTIHEALLILKAQKKYLHPLALPVVLHHLAEKPTLWLLINDVLGHRAIWLSQLRHEWTWWYRLKTCDGAWMLSSQPVDKLVYWLRTINPELCEDLVQNLNNTQRKKYLSAISVNPHNEDLSLMRSLRSTSKGKEFSLCQNILVQIDPEYQKQLYTLATDYSSQAFAESNGNLLYTSLQDVIRDGDLFHLDNIEIHAEYISNPYLRALSLTPIREIFGHLTIPPASLCEQLMLDPDLDRICQVVSLSAAYHHTKSWQEALVRRWISHYPEGNTVSVDFTPLFQSLHRNSLFDLINDLLSDHTSWILEQLDKLLGSTRHFLNIEVSTLLIKRVLLSLATRMSRTDKQHLKSLIKILGSRMDPRVHSVLVKDWPEETIYFSGLGKDLWSMRKKLKDRIDIFNYIVM